MGNEEKKLGTDALEGDSKEPIRTCYCKDQVFQLRTRFTIIGNPKLGSNTR